MASRESFGMEHHHHSHSSGYLDGDDEEIHGIEQVRSVEEVGDLDGDERRKLVVE